MTPLWSTRVLAQQKVFPFEKGTFAPRTNKGLHLLLPPWPPWLWATWASDGTVRLMSQNNSKSFFSSTQVNSFNFSRNLRTFFDLFVKNYNGFLRLFWIHMMCKQIDLNTHAGNCPLHVISPGTSSIFKRAHRTSMVQGIWNKRELISLVSERLILRRSCTTTENDTNFLL